MANVEPFGCTRLSHGVASLKLSSNDLRSRLPMRDEDGSNRRGDGNSWPIATGDALTARRRFRGIADMDRFSSRNDL